MRNLWFSHSKIPNNNLSAVWNYSGSISILHIFAGVGNLGCLPRNHPNSQVWLNSSELETNTTWSCTLCSLEESSQTLCWVSQVSRASWESNPGDGFLQGQSLHFHSKDFLVLEKDWAKGGVSDLEHLFFWPKLPSPHQFDSCSVTTKTGMMDLILEHNIVCLEKHPL